jgi:hypothetical protein
VINALTLITRVHRQPSENGYAITDEVSPDGRLVPSLAPALALSLGELELG